jgi:signal transduction histidine kinase
MELGQVPASESPLPNFIAGSHQPLGLMTTLASLPTYQLEIDAGCSVNSLVNCFEQFPGLPGVVLRDQGQVVGLISRQQFLEHLLRPEDRELFWTEPLRLLHRYVKSQPLWLSGQTTILTAAQQVLKRPMEFQSEPIGVEMEGGYRLLSAAELNVAYWQIRGIEIQVGYERLQMQMLQSDKMADLGRLVDGVAHEILDPVSFIWGNLSHISNYAHQLLELVRQYETELPEGSVHLQALRTDMEVEYIQDDLPMAIKSVRGGANRLRQLAISLQNFCHIDEVYPKPADLHGLLDSILLLLQSRLDSQIQITREYEKLPPVPCFAGQMGQVFMNILVSLIDALLEQIAQQDTMSVTVTPSSAAFIPKITISTQVRSFNRQDPIVMDTPRWVSVVIQDNGPGLPPEAEMDLMQTFSAHTRIIKETSLSMSYHIITAKHGGQFQVRSQRFTHSQHHTPQGTQFEILLPLFLSNT